MPMPDGAPQQAPSHPAGRTLCGLKTTEAPGHGTFPLAAGLGSDRTSVSCTEGRGILF